jgi:hypothetical protein
LAGLAEACPEGQQVEQQEKESLHGCWLIAGQSSGRGAEEERKMG